MYKMFKQFFFIYCFVYPFATKLHNHGQIYGCARCATANPNVKKINK